MRTRVGYIFLLINAIENGGLYLFDIEARARQTTSQHQQQLEKTYFRHKS
jgi:hypothetical protein